MKANSLLITQCLQNDFVQPIGRYDPMPNLLHVGYEESRRLMGENPEEGPVAHLMRCAYAESPAELGIIHIRDWHDPSDPHQESHFRLFGRHCVHGTAGAEFAFRVADTSRHAIVDSLTLNDFDRTTLAASLSPFAGRRVRVGIAGVWTEAKVFFLAYELATRYPEFEIAICSALTAGSSRAHHFIALDQISRLLAIRVIASIGEFIEFLGGDPSELSLITDRHAAGGAPEDGRIAIAPELPLEATDKRLLQYLFRDSRSAKFRSLDGGFSGNVVLGSESEDLYGNRQAPHVVKIGPRDAVGRERASFERIESVLGNTAPHVAEFADLGDRGAIKYRYASMGGASSTTFQKLYMSGISDDEIRRILNIVFREQLGRFYVAATRESMNLFEYYLFSPKWAASVRKKVEAIVGAPVPGSTIELPGGIVCPNVCDFYEQRLAEFSPERRDTCYFSYVHGDLNGANIMIDGHSNVWIIDFFHTGRGHILRDLAKLENDLLYIFTPVENEVELREAASLTDFLIDIADLGRPLPPDHEATFTRPALARAYRTLVFLRGFYPELIQTDRDPLQSLIAMMRYAVHTLGFDESSLWQKRWALYTAARCGEEIVARIRRTGPLRIDWLPLELTEPGRVGLTILPGRLDHGRRIDEDIAVMKRENVGAIVTLLTEDEYARFGVEDLRGRYRDAGLECLERPILDQSVCTPEEMTATTAWITERTARGASVVIHCVGGLGRSGTIAACLLKDRGLSTSDAISRVRTARSDRAIESKTQEEFVRDYILRPGLLP